MPNIATVILAAGKGTRMKSDLPKVLHTLNNRPMVEYVIDVAEEIGSEKVVLIVGHEKELVIETVKNRNVEFAVQAPQLGTGHAVLQSKPHFKDYEGNILVLSGDVPLLRAETLRELIQIHEDENPLGYIRIIAGKDGETLTMQYRYNRKFSLSFSNKAFP